MTFEEQARFYSDQGHPVYDRGIDSWAIPQLAEAANRLVLLCDLCSQVENVPGGGDMGALALSLAGRIAFHLGYQLRASVPRTLLPGLEVPEAAPSKVREVVEKKFLPLFCNAPAAAVVERNAKLLLAFCELMKTDTTTHLDKSIGVPLVAKIAETFGFKLKKTEPSAPSEEAPVLGPS